ncbi:MAG: acyltransferase [Sphingomonadaceae bacterium]
MHSPRAARDPGLPARRREAASYLSLIDGLRGTAALFVLVYHYVHFFMAGADRQRMEHYLDVVPAADVLHPLYRYGFMAVQVFWLISGFVFAHVYRDRGAGGRSFFVNRLARLYPLHLLTLLVVGVLDLMALHKLGYTPIYANFDWKHFVAQLFMASEWIRTGESFNGPIWSVSVEVLIYAVFWFAVTGRARRSLVIPGLMSVGFFLANQRYGNFSLVIECGYFFFAGAVLSRLCQRDWRVWWPVVIAVGLIAGGIAITAIQGEWGFRRYGAVGIVGGALMVMSFVEGRTPHSIRRICAWLGETSYGVYLWHFPIQLGVLLVLLPQWEPRRLAQHGWFLAVFIVVVVLVARLSYRFYELPMRDLLRKRLKREGTVANSLVKGGDKPAAAR